LKHNPLMEDKPKPAQGRAAIMRESRVRNFLRPPLRGEQTNTHLPFVFQMTMIELHQPSWNALCPKINEAKRKPNYHAQQKETPAVLLFGITAEGNSVCATVTGFRPYIWIEAPECWHRDEHVQLFLDHLVHAGDRHRVSGKLVRDRWTPSFGFHNGEKFTYVRIEFETDDLRKSAVRRLWDWKLPFDMPAIGLKDHCFTPIEYQIPWQLQFFEARSLETSGWCRIDPGHFDFQSGTNARTTCQLNVNVNYHMLEPHECMAIAPLLIASFDIECYRGANDNKFPNPETPGDKIIQIATAVTVYGESEPCYSNVFCLDTVAPCSEFEVRSFPDEKTLLSEWAKFWRNLEADALTGYNIFQFDLMYLMTRMVLNEAVDAFQLGKVFGIETKVKDSGITSNAYASNKWKVVPMAGVQLIDMHPVIKREHKLANYKLNTVAQHFLGQQKEDVNYEQIQEFQTRDAESRLKIASYCRWDAILPLSLMFHNKIRTIESLVEMSRITKVPIDYLVMRGQSIKVLSQFMRACHANGYLVTEPPNHKMEQDSKRKLEHEDSEYRRRAKEYGMRLPKKKEEKEYTGATVINPLKGFYREPIPTLDFASLYPSIMIGHNLCYTTLVTNERYANIPGIEYEISDVENLSTGAVRRNVFVLNRPGILPKMLSDLLAQRAAVRKRIPTESDPAIKSLLNFRQLNLKISANSIYGFTGATVASLPCVSIAETVTHFGRQMLGMVKAWLKEHYPRAIVIYGDSVTGDTPLLLRNRNGDISLRTIQELFADGYDVSEKQMCECDLEVWSDRGFTPIRRVIRHQSNKQLYRITAHNGSVTVTEDHSLLDAQAAVVSPSALQLGTELLTAKPPPLSGTARVAPETAWLYGLFFACGHSTKFGIWCVINPNLESIQRAEAFMSAMPVELEISKCISDGTPFYNLHTLGATGKPILNERTANFYSEWYALFYNGTAEKQIPNVVWMWNEMCRRAFLDGYLAAQVSDRFDSQVAQAGIYLLLQSLNLECNANSVPAGRVLQIEPLGITEDWVYDLETENHHFSAGIGELVVHNTDSVMIRFRLEGERAFERTFELAPQVAAEISKLFPRPCKLEFEKIYYPMLLSESKKVYAGMLWTKPDKPDYMDAKGFKFVKRDTCKLVSATSKEVLRLIMNNDLVGAVHYLQKVLDQIHSNEIPQQQYIITMMLARDMDSYDQASAHVELARRMRDRDPNNAPHSGDRVPYVAVDIGDVALTRKLSERIEDPVWAEAHGMRIDRHWYIRCQLQEPLVKILKLSLKNPEEIFNRAAAKQIRLQSGIVDLTSFSRKTAPQPQPSAPAEPSIPSWLQLYNPESEEVKSKQQNILQSMGFTLQPKKKPAAPPKAAYRPALAKQQDIKSAFTKKK